jgi:hypothetical protein
MPTYTIYKIGQLIVLLAFLLLALKIIPFLGYSQIAFAAYGTALALMVDKPKRMSDSIGCRWIAARFLISVLGIVLTVSLICSLARWNHSMEPSAAYMFNLRTEIAFLSVSSLIVYAACFLFIVMPLTANQLPLENQSTEIADAHTSKKSPQNDSDSV